jgi:hypothetical protein
MANMTARPHNAGALDSKLIMDTSSTGPEDRCTGLAGTLL